MVSLELLWAIIGFALGMSLGSMRSVASRKKRAKPPVSTPDEQPICGCNHGLEQHDPADHRCYGEIKRASKWDDYGSAIRWTWVPCTCRQYVGPEKLDMGTYFAGTYVPPVLPETETPKED